MRTRPNKYLNHWKIKRAKTELMTIQIITMAWMNYSLSFNKGIQMCLFLVNMDRLIHRFCYWKRNIGLLPNSRAKLVKLFSTSCKKASVCELFSLFIVWIDIYTSVPAALTTRRMKTIVFAWRFRKVLSVGTRIKITCLFRVLQEWKQNNSGKWPLSQWPWLLSC